MRLFLKTNADDLTARECFFLFFLSQRAFTLFSSYLDCKVGSVFAAHAQNTFVQLSAPLRL